MLDYAAILFAMGDFSVLCHHVIMSSFMQKSEWIQLRPQKCTPNSDLVHPDWPNTWQRDKTWWQETHHGHLFKTSKLWDRLAPTRTGRFGSKKKRMDIKMRLRKVWKTFQIWQFGFVAIGSMGRLYIYVHESLIFMEVSRQIYQSQGIRVKFHSKTYLLGLGSRSSPWLESI